MVSSFFSNSFYSEKIFKYVMIKRVALNKMCLDVNANYPYQLGLLYTAASNQVP